jgi:hypothetical protein
MTPNTVSTPRSPRLATVIVGSDSSELRKAPTRPPADQHQFEKIGRQVVLLCPGDKIMIPGPKMRRSTPPFSSRQLAEAPLSARGCSATARLWRSQNSPKRLHAAAARFSDCRRSECIIPRRAGPVADPACRCQRCASPGSMITWVNSRCAPSGYAAAKTVAETGSSVSLPPAIMRMLFIVDPSRIPREGVVAWIGLTKIVRNPPGRHRRTATSDAGTSRRSNSRSA